jgi:PKD repeat protein
MVTAATSGHAKVLTPWLAAGSHTLRVFIDNSYWFRRVTVDQLQVLSAQGPDADSNGTPDWIDARLARTNSIEAPAESLTSPVCLEGKSMWSALTTVADAAVQPAPNDRWYADVPLDATQPTSVTASLENGALPAIREITWIPTNLLTTPALTIRKGDSLKLSAFSGVTATPDETLTITVEGQTLTTTADQAIVHTFTTAGSIPVQVTHSLDGNLTTSTATINVVAAPAVESPVCVVGCYREVSIPALPNGVSLQLDNRIETRGTTTYPAGGQLHILRLNTLEDRTSVFRIGGTSGPILNTLPFHFMGVRTGSKTVVMFAADLGNNTWDVEMPVIIDGIRPEITLAVEIIIGGVTFDNGSLQKTLAYPADVSPEGDSLLHFYKTSTSGSNCHRIKVSQDQTIIAYFQ